MKKIITLFMILFCSKIILTSETDEFKLNPDWTDADILRELEDPNSKLSRYLDKDNGRAEFIADLGLPEQSRQYQKDRSRKNAQYSQSSSRKHEKQD